MRRTSKQITAARSHPIQPTIGMARTMPPIAKSRWSNGAQRPKRCGVVRRDCFVLTEPPANDWCVSTRQMQISGEPWTLVRREYRQEEPECFEEKHASPR